MISRTNTNLDCHSHKIGFGRAVQLASVSLHKRLIQDSFNTSNLNNGKALDDLHQCSLFKYFRQLCLFSLHI